MLLRRLTLAAVLVCAPGYASQPPSNGWEVVVRPFQAKKAEGAGFYWIGLRNGTTLPRAFCLLGVIYVYETRDGSLVDQPTREYPGVRGVGPCAPTLGHLVLPGETHFVTVQVMLPADADLKRGVRFRITAEETCAVQVPCQHAQIMVSEKKAVGP
jgi:hypothetical protein